jgi:hypothetical protein
MKKVFWGLFLVLVAAFIIINSLGIIPVALGAYHIIALLILVPLAVSNLFSKEFVGALLPLGFLFMFFKGYFDLTMISNWSILFASLFAGIGLELIFNKRSVHFNCDWN